MNNRNSNSIPAWEDLCIVNQHFAIKDQTILTDIEQLKGNPPQLLVALCRMIIGCGFGDSSWVKFLRIDWGDCVDLIHDVLLRNTLRGQSLAAEDNTPVYSTLNRDHGQLPCTNSTSSRRVEKITQYCDPNDPLLILGDDDHMGIFLMDAGFTDVTTVDIDPKVCASLQTESRHKNLPLKVIQHDISQKPLDEWRRPYRLVFMDPMYTIPGVQMFLDSAFQFLTLPQEATFFLNVHLLSLLRSGLTQLAKVLEGYQLELKELQPAFNRYPIPPRLNFLISLFNRNCMRTRVMQQNRGQLQYFMSDALILQGSGAFPRYHSSKLFQ